MFLNFSNFCSQVTVIIVGCYGVPDKYVYVSNFERTVSRVLFNILESQNIYFCEIRLFVIQSFYEESISYELLVAKNIQQSICLCIFVCVSVFLRGPEGGQPYK